ncbi:MAG: glycosyltransferase family 4 protein [Thermomicrobiales bacterium]|nr:glycosyltransferase family 4 protein [Thermomicrobiales bacterium]MCO5225825.1 glycosyltransferase family 4 protein [Thermomicrobiales bacterium]MCO5228382.1 glycosyltransferase family 4 protein [Thermomicrobiales bacterium]
MRILQVLYYYEPYTSGLTIYAARLAREMTARGHQVQVICSRHESTLPKHEVTADRVDVTRLRVLANVDRAVLLPGLIPTVLRRLHDVDVVHLHLPMAETALLVALCRLLKKRVVVTHHADLVLAGSPLARLAANVANVSSIVGGRLADVFVTNTYARAKVSPVSRFMRRNLEVIPPPILPHPLPADARQAFRDERDWGSRPVIGFVGRYASEKGLEILLQTIPLVRMRYPDALFALAGPHTDPRTGKRREGPWSPWLARYGYAVEEFGYISDDDLGRFYAAIDVLALPSIDWTESFGMVQIEAMQQGTPVVASDLPGVSDPVRVTGGGIIVRPGDMSALASAIAEVLGAPERYVPDQCLLAENYSLAHVTAAWERVYGGAL